MLSLTIGKQKTKRQGKWSVNAISIAFFIIVNIVDCRVQGLLDVIIEYTDINKMMIDYYR